MAVACEENDSGTSSLEHGAWLGSPTIKEHPWFCKIFIDAQEIQSKLALAKTVK